MRLEKKKN